MTDKSEFELAPLFQAVGDSLSQNRDSLNQADEFNGNHGDNMVEVFQLATKAALEKRDFDLADAMEYAGYLLEVKAQNGSAQVYARGLAQFAEQFRFYKIAMDDLLPYVQGILEEKKEIGGTDSHAPSRAGDVLKALVAGLAGWQQTETEAEPSGSPLDLGALFELGMAYMGAKQRGGSRIEVLADAAASASPLSSVPHRYKSGKLAIQALLQAMKDQGSGASDQE